MSLCTLVESVFCLSQVASGAAVEGVCGYGDTSQTLFPRLNVASVSAANPGRICGTCIQVRCLQVMPAELLAALQLDRAPLSSLPS
jgi:hypothetical protein